MWKLKSLSNQQKLLDLFSEDKIDLTGIAGLADFTAVIAAADESTGNVRIDLDGSFDGFNVIHLQGVVNITELSSDDFIF